MKSKKGLECFLENLTVDILESQIPSKKKVLGVFLENLLV